jgi:hypothetical protein
MIRLGFPSTTVSRKERAMNDESMNERIEALETRMNVLSIIVSALAGRPESQDQLRVFAKGEFGGRDLQDVLLLPCLSAQDEKRQFDMLTRFFDVLAEQKGAN